MVQNDSKNGLKVSKVSYSANGIIQRIEISIKNFKSYT